MPAPNQLTVGGQAVIEGVMMRGPKGYAVAVRRASGAIQTIATPHVPLSKRYPILNTPVLRGAVGLLEMMSIGMRSLEYSAAEASKDLPPEPKKKKGNVETVGDAEPPAFTRKDLIQVMAFSLCIGLTLFVVIPNIATHFLGNAGGGGSSLNPFVEEKDPIKYNLLSGAIRMMIVVGYIYAISFMKDVKRLFMYHGAEHKAVSAFEAGKELTVENVRPMTRLHPRCGTTFIAITLLVSILVFALFAWVLVAVWPAFFQLNFWLRKTILILGHIAIMPLVAGVCFEILRLGGKYRDNALLKALITPGYWFQHLTVREPDDSMIEVAIHSLKAALDIEVPVAMESPAYVEDRMPVEAVAS